MASSSSFLDLYDPLDVIGNGSFGIIRKVRRKSDGIVRFGYHLRGGDTHCSIFSRFLHEKNLILNE